MPYTIFTRYNNKIIVFENIKGKIKTIKYYIHLR